MDTAAVPLSGLELAGHLSLAVAMSIFMGLAFEDVYKHNAHDAPGGIRTFPLLTLGGCALYLADPSHGLAFVAGVLGVSAWLYAYLRAKLTAAANISLMVPAANLLAFGMGPLAIGQPAWITVAIAVAAVLLLGQREHLHQLVGAVPQEELTTAGKFLILAGVIFPLAPREPIASWLPITPYKMWLAVLAVSSLSYLSYLLQRYLPRKGNTLLPAILGGAYSSTMTTVVLARRQKALETQSGEISAGIVAATTVMYLRVGIMAFLFNAALAAELMPYLALSVVLGSLLVAYEWTRNQPRAQVLQASLPASINPLSLGSAAAFAALFVVISVLAGWIGQNFGKGGIMGLALVSGAADIDPFLLNLVQGGAPALSQSTVAGAILLAVASNNVLKAIYAVAFGGAACRRPAIILGVLALSSLVGVAMIFARM